MHTKSKINYETLTNDLLFKETFAHPHNRKLLEHFLEVYFNYEDGFLHKKLAVSYESILNKTRLNDKSMRSDLIIVVDNKMMVTLEMYSTFTKESIKKSEQHIMRIHSTQLDVGDDYKNLKKTTQINFIGEVKVKIEDEVITTHRLFDENLDGGFSLDVIRLDLVDKLGYNLKDEFKKILLFIGAETNAKRKIIAKGDELLMEANEWIEKYQNNKTLREFFIRSDKIWDKREGYFEGIAEGKTKGIAERNTEIAKNLLKRNMPIKDIAEITNLSIEEIEELKK